MNLDELRTVQSKERQKDSLQNLRPSFYQEVGEYIADLEAERERVAERAADPFSSPEVGRLTDEIETARDVVEAIYERRMGKLVKQASLSAAGMPADDEGLTAEEQDLFEDLVDRIQSNKSRVLDTLDDIEETADPADAGAATDPIDGAGAPAGGAESDRAEAPSDEPDPSNSTDPARTHADGSSEGGVSPADVMGGDAPTEGVTAPSDSAADSPDRREGVLTDGPTAESAADAAECDTERPTDDGADGVERLTVRITQDIGSILGVDDREYTLSRDDVVTLPEQNATPLVDREAAEPLD
ncbi:hypothetical protein [Halosolutus gelatinilyticus]|uniref:DNA replication complex subunit Gins51 n=1 Tax=Halosolutus gelatinilyticus TaxID=2931975 RepID=UPI001FF4680F|nr:hypothetical protein [Halosolutus gelatinilyticus]